MPRQKMPDFAISTANARAVTLSFAGLTGDQIAELEGVTERTVRDRLAKGIAGLNLPDHIELNHQRLYFLLHKGLEDIETIMDLPMTPENMGIKLKNAQFVIERTLGHLQRADIARKAANKGDQPPDKTEEDEQLDFEARAHRMVERWRSMGLVKDRQQLTEVLPNNGGINGSTVVDNDSGPDRPDLVGERSAEAGGPDEGGHDKADVQTEDSPR